VRTAGGQHVHLLHDTTRASAPALNTAPLLIPGRPGRPTQGCGRGGTARTLSRRSDRPSRVSMRSLVLGGRHGGHCAPWRCTVRSVLLRACGRSTSAFAISALEIGAVSATTASLPCEQHGIVPAMCRQRHCDPRQHCCVSHRSSTADSPSWPSRHSLHPLRTLARRCAESPLRAGQSQTCASRKDPSGCMISDARSAATNQGAAVGESQSLCHPESAAAPGRSSSCRGTTEWHRSSAAVAAAGHLLRVTPSDAKSHAASTHTTCKTQLADAAACRRVPVA
jgi:hypothetical protein